MAQASRRWREVEFSTSDHQACKTLHAPKIMVAVPATDNGIYREFRLLSSQHFVKWAPSSWPLSQPRDFAFMLRVPHIDLPLPCSKEWDWALVPSSVIMDHRKSSPILFRNPCENKTKIGQNSPWARRLVNISQYRWYRGIDTSIGSVEW